MDLDLPHPSPRPSRGPRTRTLEALLQALLLTILSPKDNQTKTNNIINQTNMSSMSRLIPALRGGRARSASPNIPLIPKHQHSIIGTRTTPFRSVSPLSSAFLDNSRTYITSTTLPGEVVKKEWEQKTNKSSFRRSFSDVALPEPPTSNHPHKPLPGAKGRLIYTET